MRVCARTKEEESHTATTKDDERRGFERLVGSPEVSSEVSLSARARAHAFVREVEDGRSKGRRGWEVKRGIWIVNRGRVERERRVGAWMTDGDDE